MCLKVTIDESYNGGAQLRDTTPEATSTSTQYDTADSAAVVSTVELTRGVHVSIKL